MQAVITLPVYLNANRKDVLFSAEFRLASGQSQAAIVEKGVAVGVSKFSDSEEIYQAITKVISNER